MILGRISASLRGRVRSEEDGFSLPELLVGMGISGLVAMALFTFIQTTSSSSARTTERVAANQTARLGLQRLMDELHSTCIFPGLAPVKAGSTGQSIAFIHGTGSQANVAPVATGVPLVPTRRVVSLVGSITGGRLVDTNYALASNSPAAPNWTFNTTAARSFVLVPNVRQIGSLTPTTSDDVPVFRYYGYSNGAISTTPYTVPLSSTDAAKVVQVSVAFESYTSTGAEANDDNNDVTLTEQALLRFSPSNEDTSKAGLPCT